MSAQDRTPARWRDDERWRPLLEAAEVEVDAAAMERIWRKLEAETSSGFDAELMHTAARAVEPPVGAHERIWAALEAETSARAGIVDPPRLSESDPSLRKLLVDGEVEPPLGRRARILPRIQARPRLQPSIVYPLLAAAAAITFVLLRPNPSPVPPPPVIAENATADTELVQSLAYSPVPGVSWKQASSDGSGLLPGDALALVQDEPARLSIGSVGEIVLAERGASLELVRSDRHGIVLSLRRGLVAIHADKRQRASPLSVVAQGTRVTVVGTVFAIDARSEIVRVDVHEGIVEVTRDGSRIRVTAGESWSSDRGAVSMSGTLLATADLMRGLVTPPSPPVSAPARTPSRLRSPVRPSPATKPAPVARPTQPPAPLAFDLDALAAPLVGQGAVQLRERARDFARQGDVLSEAVALYASTKAIDARASDKASTLSQVAQLVDVELGQPISSLELWRQVAREQDTQAGEALWQVLMLSIETGRTSEALAAADECRRTCGADRRDLAPYARAVALRRTSRYGESLREAQRLAPRSLSIAAMTFAHRARELRMLQPERAALDARIAASLDPEGIPSDIRALVDEP